MVSTLLLMGIKVESEDQTLKSHFSHYPNLFIVETSNTFLHSPRLTIAMPNAITQWNVSMMSLCGRMHNINASTPTPQEGIQNIRLHYKQQISTFNRIGHTLALKRRAVAITKLDPVSQ